MVLLSSPPPIDVSVFRYLLPERIKVRGRRNRISPKATKEKGNPNEKKYLKKSCHDNRTFIRI